MIPVLPIGVSRHFWAVACVRIGASPNNYFNFISTINQLFLCVKLNLEKICLFSETHPFFDWEFDQNNQQIFYSKA